MRRIQIELARDDFLTIQQLKQIDDLCVVSESDHLEGGIDAVSVIVGVTTTSIPVLMQVIRSHVASKKHIKVRLKGIEVSGASLKDIAKFINELNDKK